MSRTALFRSLAICVSVIVGATACSSSSSSVAVDDATATTTESVESAEITTTAAAPAETDSSDKPVVEVPAGPAPTELEINDLSTGDGKVAAPGDYLTMHYVGVLHADGSEFDSSWSRDTTFSFALGVGQVITGWDEGIVGMAVGGRRVLSIPSEMAYGSASPSPAIPADSALVFVVDLLGAVSPVDEIDNADAPVDELQVEVIEAGTGAEILAGQVVEVHFVAVDQVTGDVIDNTWIGGQPAQFVVGSEPAQTIDGWNEALVGAHVGDRLRILIPAGMGIADGSGVMTDGATLVTDVTILSVQSAG